MRYETVKKRIHTFYKQHIWQVWLLGIILIAVFFCFHNERLYHTSIGKVIDVKTTELTKAVNYNSENTSTKEMTYRQLLTIQVKNGAYKGEKITVKSEYAFSRVDTEKYKKGDRVFLTCSGGAHISKAVIKGVKRDQYAILLIAVFLYLTILMAGKRGILTLVSLICNISIFLYGLKRYQEGVDLLYICNILLVIFTIMTLLLVNGFNKGTLASVISTLITEVVIIQMFHLVLKYGQAIDYAELDYVIGVQDLETIFIASISIAGLGAIMDVAVSMSAALNELVIKNPKITMKQMLHSGRRFGYDIMGTMLNVLLFTYVCGLLPIMIIKMRNDVRLLTILRLQIPFEISRFLIGGIGILLAIPISIACSIIILKLGRKKV